MFALDTNSIIYVFKGMGGVAERLLETPPHEIAVPAVVVYELEVGIAKSASPEKRSRQLRDLLAGVSVLAFDRGVAAIASKVRAGLEQAGSPIGPLDNLIAGTALRHGATLVTRNVREFGKVPGLAVEDWY